MKPLLWRTDSRFAEPRKVSKGFNFVCAKPPLRRAESRFAKPRKFPKRERFYSFRLYEKNQKYPRGLRTSGLPGTIQSFAGNIFEEASDNTSRNRLFAQNGGEKALNRCDVPALQHEDLERTAKEWPYAFVDSRLWLGGNGKWSVEKELLWRAIQKGLRNIGSFLFEKGSF